jgi:hypothetical protein
MVVGEKVPGLGSLDVFAVNTDDLLWGSMSMHVLLSLFPFSLFLFFSLQSVCTLRQPINPI